MTATPIARHLLFETADLDEARERVGTIFCQHRIAFAGKGRRLAFRQNLAPMKNVALSYVTYGEDVEIDAGEPGNWFMVHSTLRGGCAMQIGGREVLAEAGSDVISSATLGLRMSWGAECGQLVLKIDRTALETHLVRLIDDELRQPLEFLPHLDHGANTGYRRLLDFIAAEAEAEDTFFNSAPGGRHLEDTLMTMLLMRFPNSYSKVLSSPRDGATPRHVRAAEDFIRRRAADPISIEDIAAAADVSVRTLFEGFQRFRHTTPMAYLRNARMEAIRADLLAAPPETSVTDVVIKWGISNPGRFAENYRRRYDELPSATLRRAR